MSTLATASPRTKAVIGHATAAVLCFSADKIYQLFAHGVKSDYMSFMFAFPLFLGCGFFSLSTLVVPDLFHRTLVRVFVNLYNGGIAALTLWSLIEGILEIAGTASAYTVSLAVFGVVLIATSAVALAQP